MTTIQVSTDADAAAAALIKLGYAVTPPAVAPTPPTPPSTAPTLAVIIAQNGKTPNWPAEYSYPTGTTSSTQTGGDGNPNYKGIVTSGPWGGYQPADINSMSTDFSKCSNILVSVNAAKGTPFSMYFLMDNDTPINLSGSQTRFVKTVDGWERFVLPKAPMMTDVKLGDVSSKIFKGCVQLQTGEAGTFGVDNWGGV